MEEISPNSNAIFEIINVLDKDKINLLETAEGAINDLDKIKNFPLIEIEAYIGSLGIVLNKELIANQKNIARIEEKNPEILNKILSLSQDELIVLSNYETKKINSLNNFTSLRKLFTKNCVVCHNQSFTLQSSYMRNNSNFMRDISLNNTDGSNSFIKTIEKKVSSSKMIINSFNEDANNSSNLSGSISFSAETVESGGMNINIT